MTQQTDSEGMEANAPAEAYCCTPPGAFGMVHDSFNIESQQCMEAIASTEAHCCTPPGTFGMVPDSFNPESPKLV
ncbi:hypothetical protein TNCV_2944431 [Trichonephila clavipes]|nr:hypothetical protein TNCV_2944431 [Trichonephila clavipes]